MISSVWVVLYTTQQLKTLTKTMQIPVVTVSEPTPDSLSMFEPISRQSELMGPPFEEIMRQIPGDRIYRPHIAFGQWPQESSQNLKQADPF